MNLRSPRIGRSSRGRPLTGRMVLAMILGFFGAVIAVNLVMLRAAISTFGGVATPSSYEAGLNFKAEEAAAAAQDALHWRVDEELVATAAGKTVTVTAVDARGTPLTHLSVSVRFVHPADERRDVTIALQETGPGIYAGVAVMDAGQWTLDLVVGRAGVRLFHSLNRIMVQ
jgi:nitrogen fixation protein FixH